MGGVNVTPTSRARVILGTVCLIGLATTLVGCATAVPGTASASPVSVSPTQQVTPTIPGAEPIPTDDTPSTSPTTQSVSATGDMTLYMKVSSALKGECSTVDSGPTITMTDANNEFFTDVSLTLRLAKDKGSVASFDVALGEDNEGVAWNLAYDGAKPASGSSAKLTVKGKTYTVSGKATLSEQGQTKGELTPYSISATCSSSTW